LGKICFPSSLCSCELIMVIVFGIGNHIMILQIISYLVIILLLSFFLPSKVCLTNFSEMPRSNFMKPCRNIICHVKLCFNGWFFQNGCRCHGNGQNAKNWKTQKWS
jgi:hypothetical protein